MDFGKAFTFPFDDQDWMKKLGIAALLLLIPIAGFILVGGWMLELMRRVIQGDGRPMPDWDDFGGYFMKGLQVMVVGIVYGLPAILVNICQQAVTFGLNSGDLGSDETMATALMVLSVCFGCFSFIYSILMLIVLPAALGKLATTGQIGAAFRFSEVIGMVRATPGPFIMAMLGSFVAGIVAMLGVILCVIGMLATMAYAYAIQGHLFGQAYKAGSQVSGM